MLRGFTGPRNKTAPRWKQAQSVAFEDVTHTVPWERTTSAIVTAPKAEWKAGNFGKVPGDEIEFIPLSDKTEMVGFPHPGR